jgi:hypothetical protein
VEKFLFSADIVSIQESRFDDIILRFAHFQSFINWNHMSQAIFVGDNLAATEVIMSSWSNTKVRLMAVRIQSASSLIIRLCLQCCDGHQ